MERVRKQQRPERAPGSLEIVGENCESEKREVVAKKRGRKPKKKEEVLERENGEREIGAEEKEVDENNGNGVSQKEGRVRNQGGISGNGVSQEEATVQNEGGKIEVGEGNGDKTKESEVDAGNKGVRRNKSKGNLTWKGGEKNKEKERLELVAGENGKSIEEEKESGVSEDKRVLKGDKKVKLNEDCPVTGEEVFSVKEEDSNGVSENKKEFDDVKSSEKKRLRSSRKKVNYNEYEVDEEEESILGKKKRGRRRRTVKQKRKKLMAVQENGASDKEENEGVNSQVHCQKDEKNDEVKENENMRYEEEKQTGVLEGDGGEENKIRRRGPKNQGKKLKEETASELADEKEENDSRPYSLRTSTKQPRPVLKDSKKRKPNVKIYSCIVWLW